MMIKSSKYQTKEKEGTSWLEKGGGDYGRKQGGDGFS